MKPIPAARQVEFFIALETGKQTREILQSLTTEVMQWTENIWIMDLSRFYGYWLKQARRSAMSPQALWRKVFNRLLGEEPMENQSKIISLSPIYRTCSAHNPWSAVLLLQAMRKRQVTGLISLDSRSGQSLFREISWKTWWEQVELLELHLQTAKFKGFKKAGFKGQCKRLKLAAPRLDFKRPWELHILNRAGMKKRFGETLANVWSWSYERNRKPAQTIYQTQFPWKPWQFAPPPRIIRHPDYPLLYWEQISPLLMEDLSKLCTLQKNSSEKVTRIDWQLTFEGLEKLKVPIRFRNPHSLLDEKEKHTTALLQANYGFTEAINKRFPIDPQGGGLDIMPPILCWEIQITGCLHIPDLVLDIFGGTQEEIRELDALLQLENELPVNLSRFSSREDWLPEDSFLEEHFESEEIATENPETSRSLEALAEERPLYIRSSPLPVQSMGKKTADSFLESTMTKWWKAGQSPGQERNYFKHIDPEGNSLWVFQDTAGQWYQHGIFG
jgi:hypothetical protein